MDGFTCYQVLRLRPIVDAQCKIFSVSRRILIEPTKGIPMNDTVDTANVVMVSQNVEGLDL